MGFGGRAVVYLRVLIEQPEHLGRVDALIEQFPRYQTVRLLPKTDVGKVAIIPTVADDPMLLGHRPG